jgi:predicted O-linked N-acetylglucosamine transferase (SPINDLY family)
VTVPQAFQLALQHHQAARLAEAEGLYRRILAVQPNHAEALHFLGVIAHQVGRHDVAVEWLRKSIAIEPNNPIAQTHIGEACRVMGRTDEAIIHFRRALQLNPDYAIAWYNLGNALQDQGQLEEAVAAYRRALQLRSHYPEAHNNLGNALKDLGRSEEAIAAYRAALKLNADSPEIHINLGNMLRDLGRLDEAIAEYRRALELKADFPEAHNNLGAALAARGQLDEAIAAHRRALLFKPGYPEAHHDLGNALRERGQFEEAIAEYRDAIRLKPHYPEACNNLGNALRERRRFDEAITACRHALELKPDFPEAQSTLGAALAGKGEFDEAIAVFRRALQHQPENARTHSNLVYTLHFHPGSTTRMITEERQRWNRQFGAPPNRSAAPYANDRNPDRPLRIGYVSPDFRDHVVGRNLLPLFERHDLRSFEIFCYSGVVRPDKLTEEFRRRAVQWRSSVGVTDEALAGMIRRDGVDILVDLSQHLAGNRLPMFAHKPAPAQVSFAGYPESAGLGAIEYRISDRYLEEASAAQETAGHEQALLIDSFWCYDPREDDVEVNGLPARESGTITLGCLNNFCKVNEPVLRLWARVLAKVKDSRLILLADRGSHRQRILETLASEGIEGRRVEFVEYQPRREYLESYHRLDIVLDTFPYNGHTTSLDALWMGVPVVSLAGSAPVSRAGLSQLTNLGLPELAARSEDDFLKIAVELAGDLPRLAELRSSLRARMQSSPLMDAPRFARNIEVAYRSIWSAWRGHP